MSRTNQRLAGLQLQDQQPRFAKKADVRPDMKTRACMEGATADDEKYLDISSTRFDDDPMRLTSFGEHKCTEPLLAPEKGIGDALVVENAETPKPHLPTVEVCVVISVADGLLPAGSASNTLRTIFHPQPLPWSLCENTKKRANSTTTRRTNFDHLALPFYRKVIETKFRQHLAFDAGGCSGLLRGCLFLVGRRSFFSEKVRLRRCYHIQSLSVFVKRRTASSSPMKGKLLDTPCVIAVNQYSPEARKNQLKQNRWYEAVETVR